MRHEFLQHYVDAPMQKIEHVSLGFRETTREMRESSRYTRQGPQPVGHMIAVSTLVADGVQVGERQRAKNLSPNLQRQRPAGAAHERRRSVARGALLGVRTTVRRSKVEGDDGLVKA